MKRINAFAVIGYVLLTNVLIGAGYSFIHLSHSNATQTAPIERLVG